MAGIDILKKDLKSAADNYREVLRLAATHEEKAHMDSFQRLHAIANLRYVLFDAVPASGNANSVGRAVDDDTLEKRADELRKHLTEKSLAVLEKAENAVKTCQEAVGEALDSFFSIDLHHLDVWYVHVMDKCVDEPSRRKLVSFVNQDLGFGVLISWIPELKKKSTKFDSLKSRLGSYLANLTHFLRFVY